MFCKYCAPLRPSLALCIVHQHLLLWFQLFTDLIRELHPLFTEHWLTSHPSPHSIAMTYSTVPSPGHINWQGLQVFLYAASQASSFTSSKFSTYFLTPVYCYRPQPTDKLCWNLEVASCFLASAGHLMNTSSCVSTGVPTHPWDLFLKSETQLCYLFDLKAIFNSNTEKWGSVFILKCKVQIPHHLQWHHQVFRVENFKVIVKCVVRVDKG